MIPPDALAKLKAQLESWPLRCTYMIMTRETAEALGFDVVEKPMEDDPCEPPTSY